VCQKRFCQRPCGEMWRRGERFFHNCEGIGYLCQLKRRTHLVSASSAQGVSKNRGGRARVKISQGEFCPPAEQKVQRRSAIRRSGLARDQERALTGSSPRENASDSTSGAAHNLRLKEETRDRDSTRYQIVKIKLILSSTTRSVRSP